MIMLGDDSVGKKYITKGGYIAEITNIRKNDYTDNRFSISCFERGNATTMDIYGKTSCFEEMNFVRFINKIDEPEEFI